MVVIKYAIMPIARQVKMKSLIRIKRGKFSKRSFETELTKLDTNDYA